MRYGIIISVGYRVKSQVVELFQSSKATVSEHIKNIFTEKELQKEATVRNFRTTAMNFV